MAIERRLLVILLLLGWHAPLPAQDLNSFVSGSYRAIVAAQAGRPFVLAFWSIDCPPCYTELKMLGETHNVRPFDLILVATDDAGSSAEVARVLARFGLATANAWIFAAPPERLRFEVDRTWYGELPRSYLFREGQRKAVSGALERETLDAWLESQRP